MRPPESSSIFLPQGSNQYFCWLDCADTKWCNLRVTAGCSAALPVKTAGKKRLALVPRSSFRRESVMCASPPLCGYIGRTTGAAQTPFTELAPPFRYLQSNGLHAEYARHAYWRFASHVGEAPRGAASPSQCFGSRRPP